MAEKRKHPQTPEVYFGVFEVMTSASWSIFLMPVFFEFKIGLVSVFLLLLETNKTVLPVANPPLGGKVASPTSHNVFPRASSLS
jgi:hypothetical protein